MSDTWITRGKTEPDFFLSSSQHKTLLKALGYSVLRLTTPPPYWCTRPGLTYYKASLLILQNFLRPLLPSTLMLFDQALAGSMHHESSGIICNILSVLSPQLRLNMQYDAEWYHGLGFKIKSVQPAAQQRTRSHPDWTVLAFPIFFPIWSPANSPL